MDYERAFNKLVEQILKETEWAEQAKTDKNDPDFDCKEQFLMNRGMAFAYNSIKELAIKLQNDEYDFSEEES